MEDFNVDMVYQIEQKLNLPSSESEPLGQIWQIKRLKSLENWPMDKPSAEEIAEAGFYCPKPSQPNDIVKCFSCFIELDGWEPTDKPWEEHRKRALSANPPCKFIEIGKKESALKVDDFLEIQKSVMLRIVQNKCKKDLEGSLALLQKKKSALKRELQKLGMS